MVLGTAELAQIEGILQSTLQATQASSNKSVIVLDDEAKDEALIKLANKLGFSIVTSTSPSIIASPPSACCAIWGGLDALVSRDGFADEQTAGFIIESLLQFVANQSPCLIALRPENVWGTDDPASTISRWMHRFGCQGLKTTKLEDGRILVQGIKCRVKPSRPIKLGLLMSDRKQSSLVTGLFLRAAEQENVFIVDSTSAADVILIKHYSADATVPDAWKNAKMVDDPKRIAVLEDRTSMSAICVQALTGLSGVCVPFYTHDRLKLQSNHFPVLAKPNDASIHSNLWLVGNAKALESLTLADNEHGWFYQQCAQHSGVVFKVSVIGGDVSIARRPSAVKGDELNQKGGEGGIVQLNRRGDLHPRKKKSKNIVHEDSLPPIRESREIPSPKLVQDIATRLKKAFNLTLLGIDLIVEKRTGMIHVVDVNYFPSFVDVPGREVLLLQTIRSSVSSSSS